MLPADVDYRVMLTFLEFYQTLLQFVNFKLYHSLAVHYPPVLDSKLEEAAAGLTAIMQDLAQSSTTETSDAQPAAAAAPASPATAAAGQPQLGQQALPAAASVDLQAAVEDMAAEGLESGSESDHGLGDIDSGDEDAESESDLSDADAEDEADLMEEAATAGEHCCARGVMHATTTSAAMVIEGLIRSAQLCGVQVQSQLGSEHLHRAVSEALLSSSAACRVVSADFDGLSVSR